MPVLTEPPSMGDVLKYEVNPNYTREVVTLLAGTPYPVGSVLGRITASGEYKLATSGGSDGAQTAPAVLLYTRQHLDEKGRWIDVMTEASILPVNKRLRLAIRLHTSN
ncbi:Bacteriophage lambda head decoration protein D [Gemmobacter megaterium]|uniref:Bacteriophage lambda head decoration protein D n=1 Tax=Gemmobacter megaterium TaxID=1086013 RepID=A0A1N7QCI0_9RHOB|nr:head decoration protein [Gemmobacter megaterium]GGE25509.1 hypothetical protein GCM10011345_34330 [Gemmobacter megaterium]SIT20524.1 Bacteriophage lambda head decoration protein D [Gemmobacter megaterium]